MIDKWGKGVKLALMTVVIVLVVVVIVIVIDHGKSLRNARYSLASFGVKRLDRMLGSCAYLGKRGSFCRN